MLTLLLITIYITFISLGLPDSLLGSAWPVMQGDLGAAVSSAGIISMIVASGSIVSSFFSGKIVRAMGTGRVVVVSVAMTAIALVGNSFAPSFIWLCVFAVPLGIGGGGVDSVLNNFVANHYKARHMSWLHCFWGVGASLGPIVMSVCLMGKSGWRGGYRTIGILQVCLVAVLIFALPLWKKVGGAAATAGDYGDKHKGDFKQFTKSKLALPACLLFFCYCSLEMITGLWGSSYLVNYKGVAVEKAAAWVSLYYFGITLGRFLTGFITMKLSAKSLIRLGIFSCLAGVVLLLLPLPMTLNLAGFVLIGLGCAPVFPTMIHETPNHFGKGLSQSAMGIQMAFAYCGTTFMPPIFGLVGQNISFAFFPVFMLIFLAVMLIASEAINKHMNKLPTRI